MKKFLSALLAQAAFTISLHSTEPLLNTLNEFTSSFYQEALSSSNRNELFSPYCLFNCLSMAYLGARGETATEMEKALSIHCSPEELAKNLQALSSYLTPTDPSQIWLNIANSVWVNQSISLLPEYKLTLQNEFQAHIETLSFQKKEESAFLINEWVKNQTFGKIPNLISPTDLSPHTQLMLVSALYFKSPWLFPFKKTNTIKAPFYKTDSSTKQVSMLQQTKHLAYLETPDFQMVLLPFANTDSSQAEMSFFVILPKDSLDALENSFDLSNLFNQIKLTDPTRVSLQLPKFDIRLKYRLEPILKSLGMKKAFSSKADFSGMNGNFNLLIEKVLHEACFTLNEDGVSAAAATAIGVGHQAVMIHPPATSFIANHPFLFGIVDLNSNVVLFLGKMIDP